MSTLEIVLISAFCGMFGLALLAGVGFLIWLAMDLRKSQRAAQTENDAIQTGTRQTIEAFAAETTRILAGNQQETKTSLDSAKASFATIRAETKSILDEHRKQTAALLEEHRKAMQSAIEKINAEALTATAVRCMEACSRLEKTITIFQRLILENTDQRTPNEYGPEEYAAERTEFGGPPSSFSLSPNAAADAEADREESLLTESRSGG